MYNWEDYSKTLYAYKKDSNEESLLKHMKELEKIIEVSNQNNMRVPPGVYGELGYYYLRSNKIKEAVEYFNFEKQLYPESGILMDRLIQKAAVAKTLSDEAESINHAIKESEK
jgi:hypothetical protein